MTFTNRLIHEKSPYLLQHAHNPVDWYPWGNEAFESAEKQQKPVFLSIGYATCHWCHVMEVESFESPDLAKLLNDTFINIKVDREELPHVDSVYMEFAQALMSSAGGWPLNLVLTPDLKPIFAVTYLPPQSRRGLMGLDEFVQQIHLLWNSEERQKLVEQADKVLEIFQKIASHTTGTDLPDEELFLRQINGLFELADPVHGGIKGEPKFPLGYQMILFLRMARLRTDSRALFYSELTLEKMARGGIYDQLGGGFSRYSVDERWLIPHFEKMLYDNAILGKAYLEAWSCTRKPLYRRVCEETLQYILRELTHSEGGFYSAEDADTEGHEGLFYTWTPREIDEVLGKEDGLLFAHAYGVTERGNFEGKSILHLEVPVAELEPKVQEKLALCRAKLLKKRNERQKPFKDDKIITGWNGLAIDFFINAALVFENEEYRQVAVKAALFIQEKLWKEGHLLRRYREGESRFSAGLDDYAYLIRAVLSLFEDTGDKKWLDWATQMTEVLEKEFKAKGGAFYQSDAASNLLMRKCEYYDGAEPSGNAVHAENLLRLYQLTQKENYLVQAEDILKAAKNHITAYPLGACYFLLVLLRYLDTKAPTLVIALNEKGDLKQEIKKALSRGYAPHKTVIWQQENKLTLASFEEQMPIDGKTTVYRCHQNQCQEPLTDQEEIIKAIEGM